MKRRMYGIGILVCILIILVSSIVYATGVCVYSGSETVTVGKEIRKFFLYTCTSDASGVTATTFNPATYDVVGWYLFNITTDPDGTSAPTADYDITCLATGEDICGGLLANRSATERQTVAIAPTTLGYHMIDGSIVFTYANITSNPGIFTMKIRTTTN